MKLTFLILFIAVLTIACNEDVSTVPINAVPTSHTSYITAVYAKPDRICKNEDSMIYCIAQDDANDISLYEWHAYSGSLKTMGGEIVGYTPVDMGKNYVDLITCTVHDKAGNVTKPSSTGITIDNCIAEYPRKLHKNIFGKWSVE